VPRTSTGEREVPDHPLVRQTIFDCLHEAMDIDGLVTLLRALESGKVEVLARDLPQPSPLAQEILTMRARMRSSTMRRWRSGALRR
jgi:ATP-dependent Lhr-like helicase